MFDLDCKFNCHKKCEEEIPDNCPGEDSNAVVSAGEDNNAGLFMFWYRT